MADSHFKTGIPMKMLISICTSCYNEEDNVDDFHGRIKSVFASLPQYRYELVIMDNASTDRTAEALRRLAASDPQVRVILNTRNFGFRSGYYALMQASGDAAILMASDLQDPPELIPQFLEKWEAGYKIAVAVKNQSEESPLFFAVRRFYYWLIGGISHTPLVQNFTGFGLYDRRVVEILRKMDDPYPYFRGMICEIGFDRAEIPFVQPQRKRGFSKSNLYSLYDMAMLGITNHSKVPLRLTTFCGFCLAGLSLLVAIVYLIYKLVYWSEFQLGLAPLVIGLFFFSSVQLIFLGIVGEYVGAIHTQVLHRPLVVEKERINFEDRARQADDRVVGRSADRLAGSDGPRTFGLPISGPMGEGMMMTEERT
jgi:polyisoprenyl-phosphate glycosyltransferase